MAYTTVEMAELQYPHRIESREFIADSGGTGRWRGGCGIRSVQRILDHTARATCVLWGGKYPSTGLCGGGSGSSNAIRLEPARGTPIDVPPGQATDVDLPADSLVTMTTGGGGGWGNPLERSPEQVVEDVINGYLTIRGAADDYGVHLDPITYELDLEMTSRDRAARMETQDGKRVAG